MISLKRSLDEFDILRSIERTALECYRSALKSAEHYLVEVDPADARETHRILREVHSAAEHTTEPERLHETHGQFRAVIRDYQERAHGQIARLRSDLESALSAMQSVADSMSDRDGDHREQLSRELVRLRAVAGFQDVTKIRAGVVSAVQGIEGCVERMQRENQLVIAQLCDEIRVLHDRVDAVGKLATIDPSTGLLNRAQTEYRVEGAASAESTLALCLIHIAVRNFKLLCHQSGRDVVETAMTALAARIRGIFGADAVIGRWSDEEILILHLGDPPRAMALSKKAAANSSGPYPIQVGGQLRNVTLQTQVMFIERRTGETAREILRRIDEFALGPQPVNSANQKTAS